LKVRFNQCFKLLVLIESFSKGNVYKKLDFSFCMNQHTINAMTFIGLLIASFSSWWIIFHEGYLWESHIILVVMNIFFLMAIWELMLGFLIKSPESRVFLA